MQKSGAISIAIVSSLALAALSFADGAVASNKWRVELDGAAIKTGDMRFRLTPSQGDATDVTVNVKAGLDENAVAKDVRDALAAKLSPQRYSVEVDDGEDVLIKKKEGQPDFAFELVDSNVPNVTIKIQSE
jgi:hypothetical protein